mgnify:CR=1 FL=1
MNLLVKGALLASVGILTVRSELCAQSSGENDRAQMAANLQAALREEGCGSCRVWVGGQGNTSLYVLDPQASYTPNDYQGYPYAWCNSGFKRVTYYSREGVVYASHSCH